MDHKFFREKGVNDVSCITETATKLFSHSCKNIMLIFSELMTVNN